MRRTTHNQDPRIIEARFNSKCKETGQTIKKGDTCLYYPATREVFCLDSEQYKEYSDWLFDLQMLGQDY